MRIPRSVKQAWWHSNRAGDREAIAFGHVFGHVEGLRQLLRTGLQPMQVVAAFSTRIEAVEHDAVEPERHRQFRGASPGVQIEFRGNEDTNNTLMGRLEIRHGGSCSIKGIWHAAKSVVDVAIHRQQRDLEDADLVRGQSANGCLIEQRSITDEVDIDPAMADIVDQFKDTISQQRLTAAEGDQTGTRLVEQPGKHGDGLCCAKLAHRILNWILPCVVAMQARVVAALRSLEHDVLVVAVEVADSAEEPHNSPPGVLLYTSGNIMASP